ncbi:MAG TPA: hypothetical protein VF746_08430 [Longimicrobium sp.]|jgi:hypothetical protein
MTTHRAPRWRTRLLLAAAIAAAPTDGAAQVRAGVDLVVSGDYVWRGITRAAPHTLQPAGWVTADAGPGVLALGAWAAWEVERAGPDDLTLAGRDLRFGEVDVWGQYTHRVLETDVTLGVVHYRFTGDEASGGLGEEASTSEAYLQLWPRAGLLPFSPRTALYWDLEESRRYLEADVTHWLPLAPFPNAPATLVLRALAGYSFDPPDAPETAPLRTFAGAGLTHADLSAAVVLPLEDLVEVPLTLHGAAHHQWSEDPATRQRTLTAASARRWWFEMGLSYAPGPPRRIR